MKYKTDQTRLPDSLPEPSTPPLPHQSASGLSEVEIAPQADGKLYMAIADIIVGDQFRKDLGNLDELAASMQRGQREPVVITKDKRLVPGFGLRRVCAANTKLKWDKIWVVVADDLDDPLDFLLAQRDAHLCQKALLTTEAMPMAKALLKLEQERARVRMLAGRPLSNSDGGRSDEKIAKFLGMGKDSFRKALEIHDAFEAHGDDPKLKTIVGTMNKKRGIKTAYDEYVKWKTKADDAAVAKTIPPLTQENIFTLYPVVPSRFQDLDFTNKKFIFADLQWNKPQDYRDLAKKCAGGWLDVNGLLAVLVGALADGKNTWLRIALLMSRYLKFRTEIVLRTPGVSTFVPIVNANRNHLLVLLFHRKDATKPQPEYLKRSLVTSYRVDGKTAKDNRYHDWGRTVGGHMEILYLITEPGDEVVDIGAGGGTMSEAAIRTGRTCIAVEDDESDCNIIRNRILTVYQKLHPGASTGTGPSEGVRPDNLDKNQLPELCEQGER